MDPIKILCFHGNRKSPLTYNGENDVSTLTPSGIKSRTILISGQIRQFTLELPALEHIFFGATFGRVIIAHWATCFFFQQSRAGYSQVYSTLWPSLELIWDFMPVPVICKFHKHLIKTKCPVWAFKALKGKYGTEPISLYLLKNTYLSGCSNS